MGLMVNGHNCWMVNIPSSHPWRDLVIPVMPFRPAMPHRVNQIGPSKESLAEAKTRSTSKTRCAGLFVCLFVCLSGLSGLFGLFGLFVWFVLAFLFLNMLFSASRLEFKKIYDLKTHHYTHKNQTSTILNMNVFFSSCWTQKWDQLWLGSWQYMAFSQNRLPRTHHFHARRLDSSSRRSVLMQLTNWFRDISYS